MTMNIFLSLGGCRSEKTFHKFRSRDIIHIKNISSQNFLALAGDNKKLLNWKKKYFMNLKCESSLAQSEIKIPRIVLFFLRLHTHHNFPYSRMCREGAYERGKKVCWTFSIFWLSCGSLARLHDKSCGERRKKKNFHKPFNHAMRTLVHSINVMWNPFQRHIQLSHNLLAALWGCTVCTHIAIIEFLRCWKNTSTQLRVFLFSLFFSSIPRLTKWQQNNSQRLSHFSL